MKSTPDVARPSAFQEIWYLDLFRGVAALLVFFEHLRVFLFDPRSLDSGILGRLIVIGAGFGHEAVVVFFILSGFLIARSVKVRDAAGKYRVGKYAVDRLTRLQTVVFPALILTAGLDLSSLGLLQGHALPEACKFSATQLAGHLTALNFIGNLCFLQTILVGVFGSNFPLWSLAYEFWFYVMFPLLLAVIRGGALWHRCLSAALIAGLAVFVGWNIALYFLLWLIGAAVGWFCEIKTVKLRSWTWMFLVLALLLFVMVGARAVWQVFHQREVADFLLGISFAVICFWVREWDIRQGWLRTQVRWLANMSYSLYAIHVPLVVFALALLVSTARGPLMATPTDFAIAAGIAVAVFVIAVGFYWAFEARTRVVRSFVERMLTR